VSQVIARPERPWQSLTYQGRKNHLDPWDCFAALAMTYSIILFSTEHFYIANHFIDYTLNLQLSCKFISVFFLRYQPADTDLVVVFLTAWFCYSPKRRCRFHPIRL